MATQTPGKTDTVLNGTTPVTIVASPAAATQRIVKTIVIHNVDTAVVTLTLRYLNSAATRVLTVKDLDVGDTLIWDDELCLDETDNSVTALLAGAPATTNPDVVVFWFDNA